MPTASMAGVIEATSSMTASGAREIEPTHATIPAIAKMVGLWGIHGANGSRTRHTAAPTNPSITSPGPKIPPDPSEHGATQAGKWPDRQMSSGAGHSLAAPLRGKLCGKVPHPAGRLSADIHSPPNCLQTP